MIRIESNSHGGRTWIARITGKDPKFGFNREFVRKHDVSVARSNVYRRLEFYLETEEGAVYEYRDLNGSARGGESGFWIVRGGELHQISRQEVLGLFAEAK